MSETTQGHWEVRYANKVFSADGKLICMCTNPQNEATPSEIEAMANARLIAAAPELLDALPEPDKLETLAVWFDMMQEQRPEWVKTDVQDDLRLWAEKARKAIAKVKGQ